MFIAIIVSLVIILVCAIILRTTPRRKPNGPPLASNCLPIIGHLLAHINPKGQIGLSPILFEGQNNENVVVTTMFGHDAMYVTRGPENVRAILGSSQLKLRVSSNNNSDAVAVSKKLGTADGGILLNSDETSWKRHRKLFVENIGRPRFIKSLIPKLNEYMDSLLPFLNDLATASKPILVNVLIGSISLDIIMDVIFTEQRNAAAHFIEATLNEDQPQPDELIDMIHGIMAAQRYFMYTPAFVFNHITTKETAIHDAAIAKFHSFVTQRMLEKTESVKRPSSGDQQTDLATVLLLDPSPEMTFKRAVSVIKEAIFGGQDTSSNMLSFLIYELARNPHIADNVYSEVLEVVGPHGAISEENITKLKFVEAVIYETSRVYNVAAGVVRHVSQDLELPESGYVLRKGLNVMVMLEQVHSDGRVWENPSKFDPSRFLNCSATGGPAGFGWNFAPFGHGIRKCPGEALALLEMKMIVASLCRRYKFHLATNEPVKIKESLVRECLDLPILFEIRA
ncbi:cytochrome P450 [Rhizoclosmatium globosum]|uniref:Cytochrome P450 n=1 Tax=Rhizoclosmatium globosum TaxID=329046 RepID=A0A1Y2D1G7_9FUNG|nr:cytochrome P450 [Rhizoclosmatium globosum]|eukprot:ORY53037.1 cytochrome P450 [Rhizoclosmatium globosum]